MSFYYHDIDADEVDIDDCPVDLAALEANDCDDPLPEYARYRDEGCGLSDSCLNCPFPRCIYEVPGGMRRYQDDQKAREIVFQHGRGLTPKQIVRLLGESLRTVQRVIREFKRNTNIEIENEREIWDG